MNNYPTNLKKTKAFIEANLRTLAKEQLAFRNGRVRGPLILQCMLLIKGIDKSQEVEKPEVLEENVNLILILIEQACVEKIANQQDPPQDLLENLYLAYR